MWKPGKGTVITLSGVGLCVAFVGVSGYAVPHHIEFELGADKLLGASLRIEVSHHGLDLTPQGDFNGVPLRTCIVRSDGAAIGGIEDGVWVTHSKDIPADLPAVAVVGYGKMPDGSPVRFQTNLYELNTAEFWNPTATLSTHEPLGILADGLDAQLTLTPEQQSIADATAAALGVAKERGASSDLCIS